MQLPLKRLQRLGTKAYGSVVYCVRSPTAGWLRCLLPLLLLLLLLPRLLEFFLACTPRGPGEAEENGFVFRCSSWPDTSNDSEKPTCRQGPTAELVVCSNCSASHGAWAARRPLVGRLEWRTVQNSSSSPSGDDALWTYPDLWFDALAMRKPCPKLTVLVTSAPGRKDWRDAIRQTWGRTSHYPNCTLRVIFFMSMARQYPKRQVIKKEHSIHRDTVAQVAVPHEPTSSMAALLAEWVGSHASGSQFVLRVTDDAYVDVPALLARIDAWTGPPSAPHLIGRVVSEGRRRHLEGCAYMAEPQVFQRLQPAFADESLSLDEASLLTGRLATKAGVALLHAEWIGPCHDDGGSAYSAHLAAGNSSLGHVTMRHLSPQMMREIHRSISEK